MAFIRQNAAVTHPRAVTGIVGPVAARRRRVGAPLGAIQPDADLTRYPNGARLSTLGSFLKVGQGYPRRSSQGIPQLSGYEPAPDLTQYTNGRPLPTIGGNQTPKAALVLLAFDRAMKAKGGNGGSATMMPPATSRGSSNVRNARGGKVSTMSAHRNRNMRGLGDDGSDDSSDEGGAVPVLPPDTSDISSNPTVITPADAAATQAYENYEYGLPSSGTTQYSASGAPMSTIAGAPAVATPTASTIGNTLSNLFRSLFGSGTTYTVPAYSSLGVSGLASPIYAGSSISTGGALLLGGGVLFFVLLLRNSGGKKK